MEVYNAYIAVVLAGKYSGITIRSRALTNTFDLLDLMNEHSNVRKQSRKEHKHTLTSYFDNLLVNQWPWGSIVT